MFKSRICKCVSCLIRTNVFISYNCIFQTIRYSKCHSLLAMNAEEFRRHGREMVDYIADYYENIRDRDVMHRVRPGYVTSMMRAEAPEAPETWEDIFKDVEDVVMPGVSYLVVDSQKPILSSGVMDQVVRLGDLVDCV